MHDVEKFGLIIFVIAVALGVGVASNRVTERLRIPAPAVFLLCAAVASDIFDDLYDLSTQTVQRIVTVALILILFEGGMHIGLRRARSAMQTITVVGIAGTFLTAGALALVAHTIFGFGWKPALLVGTALAPTDPALVFAVLGQREIAGRSGTILEGESGANDPVGIALLLSVATASGSGWSVFGHGVGEFIIEMVVGLAIGIAGGLGLLIFMRRIPLPNAALYPLRTVSAALALYGICAVAHGSGYLAVFVAGIVIGDARAPYKADIERFCSSLASLGEIVAFAILGLTIHLDHLYDDNALWIGLAMAAILSFVIRPVLVGALLVPVRLRLGEKAFILWSGLKGAVPILLGTFVITSGAPDAHRLYNVIFIVVGFSVLVQGSLVPAAAKVLGVPMRVVAPQPWPVGVRLRDEPTGLRHYRIVAGALADGRSIEDLPLGEDVWISLVTRDDKLVAIRGDTVLHAGDQVLAVTDPEQELDFEHVFHDPAPSEKNV